ncbi:vang-like protein 1 [Ostrinia nubilalis]|uniref:vang-like protein 1 n=1 Tax=Ostrinia nubilalis TaxID=29057 RepID=UPI0030825ED8
MMETESVRSELSSRSRRSSRHRSHTHRSTRSSKSQRKESSDMAPFQTSVNINPEMGRDGQEVIEVQILPQDENWGENTTAVTGNTSEGSQSMEDVSNWPMESDSGIGFVCSRYFGTTIALGLSFVSFVSPLAMVVLPKIGFFPGLTDNIAIQPSQRIQLLSCTAECKGILLSLAFKLVLLAIGVWAVFLRPRNAILPRIFVFRAMTLVILAVCIFSYWLFYIVQITEATKALAVGEEAIDYNSLVSYVSSFADTLLFIHYIAVILMEIRHLEPVYYIKIVRSPDGESRSYAIGQLSIQRAAVWVLQKYYTEFPIYNPYLEKISISKSQRKGQSSIKFYDVDGSNTNAPSGQARSTTGSCTGSGRGRRDSGSAHNERYYEEAERSRRVRKRRARLLCAAEDAFAHVRRVRLTSANGGALGPREAAQAVFPSLARALQKYLRATRQQPRHSADSVLAHLARCLSQDASPRAFLEPFFVEGPVLSAEQESRPLQRWALISDELLARPLASSVEFQLRQGDVSLICSIKQLPKFSLSEEVVDPKSNRFILRLNSETSV